MDKKENINVINIIKKIYNILLVLHIIFALIILCDFQYEDLFSNDISICFIYNIFILPMITLPIGIFIFAITRKKRKIIWFLIQLIILAFIFFSTSAIFSIGFD
jgi:hypothetical protein